MRIIEQEVEAKWGATTPIAYPNVPFTPPDTGSWLKLDFVWGNGTLATKDSWNRTTGILQLAVFSPKGTGDGTGAALAELARTIFNRRRLPSPARAVMFGASSGPVTRFEESWRSFIVTTPFQVEEFAPTPIAIPGLLVWLNSDSLSALDNGVRTDAWTDVSGHNNDVGSGVLGPSVQKDVIRGHPVARFSGFGDLLQVDPLATPIPAGHSIISVANRTAGSGVIWQGSLAPQLGEVHYWTATNGGTLLVQTETVAAGSASAEATVPSLTGAWHYAQIDMPPTGYCRFFLDGFEYSAINTSGSMVSSAFPRLRLGLAASGGSAFQGDLAELLVYDHQLTAVERNTLHLYMNSRYGL